MTYVWCGIDRWYYLFNVLDVFIREWIGYAFDVSATRYNAIMSVTNSVASRQPHAPGLTIRVDNGPQYISNDFQRSVQILGADLEFIWYHTPEQNGHIESFHKTLKRSISGLASLATTRRPRLQSWNHLTTTITGASTLPSDTGRQASSARCGR